MELAVESQALKKPHLKNVQRLTRDGCEIWAGQAKDGFWYLWSTISGKIQYAKHRTLQDARQTALEVALSKFNSKKYRDYLEDWRCRLYQFECVGRERM